VKTMLLSALALCAGLAHAPAHALDPGYYVVTAYPNAGERSIDFRYWTVKFKQGGSAVLWPEAGFGYGVSSRWHTELYASLIGTSLASTKLSSATWQNEVLLTQGEWPFDLALHASVSHLALPGQGDAIEIGPALQTDIGRTQLNANLFFARGYGGNTAGPTELRYQWQVKQRWTPLANFGLQGFGELGRWDRWDPAGRQSHRAGPALFGSAPLGDGRSVSYQAAYLFGTVYGQQAGMFTMRLQYAF
jgi:hypothetical protein